MRLPRVRFTLQTLLIAIAAVAVNCWAYRASYARCTSDPATEHFELPFVIGVLPLCNLALFATARLALGKLGRWARGGRVEERRSAPPVFAFLSIHFLLLGVVAHGLVPDAARSEFMVLCSFVDRATRGWEAVFVARGERASLSVVFALLGLIVSGPPLLVCCVGQGLTARCATALSRRRFRWMACLVSLGFASAGLALCLTPRPFWDELPVALDVHVVDERTHQPVAGAFVRLTDPFSRDLRWPSPLEFTDQYGHVRLRTHFAASGQRSAFCTLGSFSPWGRWLEVSAAHHQTRRLPLTAVLGSRADVARPGVGTVTLAAGITPEDFCRQVAGVYTISGYSSGHRITIEPDGRYSLSAWGCLEHFDEYGYAEVQDGEIELIPIPDPAREFVDPLATRRYQTVAWGSCLFLATVDDDDLRGFAALSLLPTRRATADGYGHSCLVRESDRHKPLTGFPRLPARVWLKYVLDAMASPGQRGIPTMAM